MSILGVEDIKNKNLTGKVLKLRLFHFDTSENSRRREREGNWKGEAEGKGGSRDEEG